MTSVVQIVAYKPVRSSYADFSPSQLQEVNGGCDTDKNTVALAVLRRTMAG